MQVFITDIDPQICAADHVYPWHMNKQLTECCQILSSVHYRMGSHVEQMCKPFNPNHPIVVWASTSEHNYKFVLHLAWELGHLYQKISGKQHKAAREYLPYLCFFPDGFTNDVFTNPPLLMPESLQRPDDFIWSFRAYCNHKYRIFLTKGLKIRWYKNPPLWVDREIINDAINMGLYSYDH